MAHIVFTANLRMHHPADPGDAPGDTVAQVLAHVFTKSPSLRSYVLDDQGAVRKHITIYVDNEPIRDRTKLTDTVRPDSEIFVAQALSGG